MPPSRDVQSLYAIADNIDSRKPLKETLDAKALLKLIKNEALAFRESDSSKLRELVGAFHHCQALAARSPGSEQLKDSILQFMMIVDECFFFKTLTRKVKTKWGRQHLVTLKLEDSPSSKDASNDRRGIWTSSNRTVTLWMKGVYDREDSSYRFSIESILLSCVHESIHAFLWLFENEDHPKHEERVAKNGGHGSIFIEILRVVGERIEELTNSREWKQERYIDPYGPKEKRPDPVYPPMGPPGFGGPGVPSGGFPPGGFPPSGFPPSGFPPGRSPPGGFPPGGFPPGVPPSGFPPSGFPPGGFPPGGFPPGGFPPGRSPPSGFPPSGFPPSGFPPSRFPPSGFPPGGFPFHR
ncbi:hypothetical protein F4823DRAFT_639547 [Ustulina deusta]|nr:hypothetical protein F4823DRAFT_639547 [Ustulina deusta]